MCTGLHASAQLPSHLQALIVHVSLLKALTSMFHWHLRFSLSEVRFLCKMSSDPSFLEAWMWLPSTCLCPGALGPPPVPLNSRKAYLWAKDCHHLLWARAWISLHIFPSAYCHGSFSPGLGLLCFAEGPCCCSCGVHPCLLFSPLWLSLVPQVSHNSLSLVCWLQPCPECSQAVSFGFQS